MWLRGGVWRLFRQQLVLQQLQLQMPAGGNCCSKEIKPMRLLSTSAAFREKNTPLLLWKPDPSIVYWLGPISRIFNANVS